ncbi:hypothetical protein M3I54_31335 [Paraburkholderia sp. CNPSo 3274]|uniref:hypothetical protein n=1 Tax=Paraburkholderia sp. CNPSo 3274 TaxID=2940932 RepID=UPI0020B6C450|nr:hypothetical protein [Paraburkholderia sp. CNPSo 3274]MCP3711405.1 hypothetical protein [Paraburkholderia sp. CNPSo 3274]
MIDEFISTAVPTKHNLFFNGHAAPPVLRFRCALVHKARRGPKGRIREFLAGGNNSITLFIAIARTARMPSHSPCAPVTVEEGERKYSAAAPFIDVSKRSSAGSGDSRRGDGGADQPLGENPR